MGGYLNKSNGSQAQWRWIIVSNIAGALVSVLASYFVIRAGYASAHQTIPGYEFPFLGRLFLIALFDFFIIMAAYFALAKLLGGHGSFWAQSYALTRAQTPVLLDLTIVVVLVLAPILQGCGDLLGLVLGVLNLFVLPVPALMETHGFGRARAIAVECLAVVLFIVFIIIVSHIQYHPYHT